MEKVVTRWMAIILSLSALLALVAIIATATGPANISADKVLFIILYKCFSSINDFTGYLNLSLSLPISLPTITNPVAKTWTDAEENIVLLVRLPRILLSLLVGASLAIAGVTTQGIFKNPMADPYILGVSSGAALGASIVIILGITASNFMFGITLGSFAGATLSSFIVFNIARSGNKIPIETLLLSGIAVSAFFSAITSFLMYISGKSLNQIVFWIMGALSGSNWNDVIILLPFALLGSLLIFAFSRDLNILLLGDETAANLGTDVSKLKVIMLVLSSLIAAAAVSVSGIIGFVGLIIPHMMRIIVGPDHRILIPSSILAGAIFLMIADTFSRMIAQPTEIPVGIITAVIGAPFFIYLIMKKKKSRI